MSREYKKLRKENNRREELILEENEEIYTNMIVYMRAADISMQNQEIIRSDIIDMVLEGQDRGDNINDVMGENYKQVCDEILEEVPPITTGEKVKNIVTNVMMCIWILGFIAIITKSLDIIVNDKSRMITFSVGNILSIAGIILVSNIVVINICKNAFKEEKNNKKSTFAAWFILFIIYLILFSFNIFISVPLFTIHVGVMAAAVALIFAGERLLNL